MAHAIASLGEKAVQFRGVGYYCDTLGSGGCGEVFPLRLLQVLCRNGARYVMVFRDAVP